MFSEKRKNITPITRAKSIYITKRVTLKLEISFFDVNGTQLAHHCEFTDN